MRKNAKERRNNNVNEEMNISGFIKIIVVILVVLVIFSLITMYVTRDKTNNDEPVITIQYDKIIVGSILNRGEEEYYVLVEYTDDENIANYESLISSYNNRSEHLRIYTVDLSEPFNLQYISEESNFDIDNITDIKFSETTLLHIINGNIASYRAGDDIESYLANLSA